jgi:hypothetical protein
MNPEFLRNVWLEMTPRRMGLMAGLLLLAFLAASLNGGAEYGPPAIAPFLYYVIVVVWGSRNAAMGVVGEIRDRTWDMQRLSSLSAATMTWGKLFGSTIYNWFGGAICLAVAFFGQATHEGVLVAVLQLIFYVFIGVIAQAASLLASLIAINRKEAHSRLEIFLYQVIGLCAAVVVYWVWSAANPEDSLVHPQTTTDTIPWWGITFAARPFLLISLAIFAAWTLIGCYREMRLELKMRNGPLVWLVFLAFMGLYVAGFDAWLSQSSDMKLWSAVSLRLALAGTTFAALTYLMVLLEPKDRVHYRWMESQIRAGHIVNAFTGIQAWMMSYAALFITVVLLVLTLFGNPMPQAFVLAALGFVTRDVAIFIFMQTLPGRRRGDLAALVILFMLYVLIPLVLGSIGGGGLLFLFFPQPDGAVWLSAIAGWAEGIGVAILALTRLALTEREEKAAAAA